MGDMVEDALEVCECIQCDTEQPLGEFRILRGRRRKVCRTCEQANAREVQTRELREVYGEAVEHIDGDLKWCGACDTVQSISAFRRRARYKDGHASKCQHCVEEGRNIMSKKELAVFRGEEQEELQQADVVEATAPTEEPAPAPMDKVEPVKEEASGLGYYLSRFWRWLSNLW